MIARILIFAALTALLAPPADAERVGVVGTRVFIDPPEGFISSPDFPGFVNPENRAVISVSEVPAAYLEISRRFTDAGLRGKSLNVVSRATIEKDGLRAQLIRAEQIGGDRRVHKWILITGDMAESMVVTASFLERSAKELEAPLEKALRDTLWESAQTLNHFEGLDFTLNEIPGLRISTRVSNTVIFTRDGRLPDQYYTGPLMIVRWLSYKDGAPEDRREHSEEVFRSIELLTDAEVEDTLRVRLDRLQGVEVIGKGKHRFLGYRVAVLQSIAYDDDRFFVAQGFSETKNREKHQDLFRTVIGTFSIVD